MYLLSSIDVPFIVYDDFVNTYLQSPILIPLPFVSSVCVTAAVIVSPDANTPLNEFVAVGAVLSSETKMGLNNRLMKIMPGEEVKEVLKRLKPYVKGWPGQ